MDRDPIEYFSRRAEDGSYADLYSAGPINRENWSFRARAEKVAKMLRAIRSTMPTKCRLLDVGCGGGELTQILSEHSGSGLYTGVDASEPMLERARRRRPGHRFIKADACALPCEDNAFDLVTALGLIEYLPRPEQGLRELARVLAPGGHLIIAVSSLACFQNVLKALVWPARKILAPVYFRVKGGRPYRVTHREFTARGLKRRLQSFGLEPAELRFYNPNPLCFPLSRLVPETSASLSARLEPFADVPGMRFMSTAFLLRARKPPVE